MSNQNDRFDFKSSYEEGNEGKLMSKVKQNPFVPVGIAGGLFALIYAAIKIKNRGNTKLSVYLIHTRVAAQGAVVGALTCGCLYQIFQDHVWSKDKK